MVFHPSNGLPFIAIYQLILLEVFDVAWRDIRQHREDNRSSHRARECVPPQAHQNCVAEIHNLVRLDEMSRKTLDDQRFGASYLADLIPK